MTQVYNLTNAIQYIDELFDEKNDEIDDLKDQIIRQEMEIDDLKDEAVTLEGIIEGLREELDEIA